MRILVLGAKGMAGHKLLQILSINHDVTGTVRGNVEGRDLSRRIGGIRVVGNVDADDFESIIHVIKKIRPEVVINGIGVIKQRDIANNALICININSLLPHKLAVLCAEYGFRLIHISTDCVFSGKKGKYIETDTPDPADLYGRSKLLGEVDTEDCLTLRTSLVGREIDTKNGIIEWFLQQGHHEVHGFRRAIFSGLTTAEFARVVELVVKSKRALHGLYHLSASPISKHDLLCMVRKAFRVSTPIVASDKPVIDRSLDSTRFRTAMKYAPPTWESMIREMAAGCIP